MTIIRCLTLIPRTIHRAVHHLSRRIGHIALHHPAGALAIVWLPCAMVGTGGLIAANHWPAIEAAVAPVAVPEPNLIWAWLVVGVLFAARRAFTS